MTGAASGIGLAIAKAFLDEGASVALTDVRGEVLDRLELPTERAMTIPMNVSNSESVESGIATVIERRR